MDLRFALMTANLISPHLKKGAKPKLKDYMLQFGPKVMTDEQIKNTLLGMRNG